jgi:hypothetical protein
MTAAAAAAAAAAATGVTYAMMQQCEYRAVTNSGWNSSVLGLIQIGFKSSRSKHRIMIIMMSQRC